MKFLLFLLLINICFLGNANAATVLERTRVIIESGSDISTLRVRSLDNSPVLIQAWIDSGNSEILPDDIELPFLVTPPITKLNPGSSQNLTVRVTDKHRLPQNQESIFWLNVLEVPLNKSTGIAPGKNILQAAFKNRIKIFYRPDKIDKPASASNTICLSEGKLVNKSPNYYSVINIQLMKLNGSEGNVSSAEIIAPYKYIYLKNSDYTDFVWLTWLDDDGIPKTERVIKC